MSDQEKKTTEGTVNEQPSKPVVPEVKQETQVMSGLDAQIHGLVQSQPTEVTKRPLKEGKFNLYDLPECCKKMQVKYAFKWVGKNERQLSRAVEVEHWVICTRKNAPFIDSHLFKVHGAVEKGGCLLAFMAIEDREMRNARYREIHNNRKKALKDLTKQPNFYKASLSDKEEGDNVGVGEQRQGRDF